MVNASCQAASAAAAGGHSPYEQSANERKKPASSYTVTQILVNIKKQWIRRDPKDPALHKMQCEESRWHHWSQLCCSMHFPSTLHTSYDWQKQCHTPVAPAVVAQLEITFSGSVTAVAAAAAARGADKPTKYVGVGRVKIQSSSSEI